MKALWEGSLRAGLSLRVDAAGRPLPLGMEDYFEPVPIGARNDMGGFILETRKTFHTPETIALKFDFGGGGASWATAATRGSSRISSTGSRSATSSCTR